jgi:hypothetical protein
MGFMFLSRLTPPSSAKPNSIPKLSYHTCSHFLTKKILFNHISANLNHYNSFFLSYPVFGEIFRQEIAPQWAQTHSPGNWRGPVLTPGSGPAKQTGTAPGTYGPFLSDCSSRPNVKPALIFCPNSFVPACLIDDLIGANPAYRQSYG